MMDPGLWELYEGEGDEEVSAIIRLNHPETVPDRVRIVSRFGEIATCRLLRSDILTVHDDAAVRSLKAPRGLVNTARPEDINHVTDYADYMVQRPDVVETGRGVVIGIVDWGCDFAHPDFIDEHGNTRLRAIWLQKGAADTTSDNPYGRGRIISRDEINQALSSDDPYAALDYHPGEVAPEGASHGTHTMGIAAGNGLGTGVQGIAPEAEIIFVQADSSGLSGLANFGDSVALMEAVDFILKQCEDSPCVINMSMGRHGGPHDGSTLVELGLDAALLQTPGLCIVNSTGNYFTADTHASGLLKTGQQHPLSWIVDAADETPNELEIWYSGEDECSVQLMSPDGHTVGPVQLDGRQDIILDEELVGRIYHRAHDPNNNKNHVDIFLYTNSPTGEWQVMLDAVQINNGRFDAWIERDVGPKENQSRFDGEDVDYTSTTGTIANGHYTLTVGAYDARSSSRDIAPFSSSGPTTDNRQKPELVAPGVRVVAASSAPLAADDAPLLTAKSGTSMAAPHVAGTVALIYEAAGRKLTIEDTRQLVLSSAEDVAAYSQERYRLGQGYLNMETAIQKARMLSETNDKKSNQDSDIGQLTDEQGNIRGIESQDTLTSGDTTNMTDFSSEQVSQTPQLDAPTISDDNDIILVIWSLQRPGDVGQYWANNIRSHRNNWDHPLSELELLYIASMRASSVARVLRMRAPVNPGQPTQEERQAARRLFGGVSAQALQRYANYENRRRIMAHYVYTHPATIRLQLGLYRLARDINPLHFALERGWQIGSGREMFTGQEVSRLGAAFEFVASLALIYGVGRLLRAARPPAGGGPRYSRSLTDPIYDLPREGGMRINGRWYTEHALERMAPDIPQVRAQIRTRITQRLARIGIDQSHPVYGRLMQRALEKINPRGVPPSVVEAEIVRPGSTNVRVITANRRQVVVTVIPRRGTTTTATTESIASSQSTISDTDTQPSDFAYQFTPDIHHEEIPMDLLQDEMDRQDFFEPDSPDYDHEGYRYALQYPATVFDNHTTPESPYYAQSHAIFESIATPGGYVMDNVRNGDILIRRALGEGNLATSTVLETIPANLAGVQRIDTDTLILRPRQQQPGQYLDKSIPLFENLGNFRYALQDFENVESGPSRTTCSVFLPSAGGGYTDYVKAETKGLVTLLINGRNSGGSGGDTDLTEPLDEMESLIRTLSRNDTVYLSSWFFEPTTPLTGGSYRGVSNWGRFFAAKAAEGIKIRILINDFDPVSGMDQWLENNSLSPLRTIINNMPSSKRDNFKFIVSRHPASFGPLRSIFAGRANISIGSHHQKFMVVRKADETTAFCGGLDIESRKVPANWSYAGLIAWHDLHVKLEGPITRDLETEFVMRWNRERSNARNRLLSGWRRFEQLHVRSLSSADQTAAKKRHRVQMTRTVSSGATLSAYTNNRSDIRESYRRIINCAERFLYLENQYYRDTSLADEIVRRGTSNPDLKVIIVVVASAGADDGANPLTSHGDYLQYETLSRIVNGLGSSRVGIYTMFNRAVHSKMIMADDRIMSIGSANANVRSFDLDSELNITIKDNNFVSTSRQRLWAHNLGVSQATISGWSSRDFISEWNRIASSNAAVSTPRDMDGEGVLIYDYTANTGSRSRLVPDYLVQLDLAPERPVFAGPLRTNNPNRRIA